jgi:hypothetical protein
MKDSGIPFPEFTPQAKKRWDRIPTDIQPRLLDNAWCRTCSSSTSMNLLNGKMKSTFLILEGTCKTCGNKVLRTVEPEE